MLKNMETKTNIRHAARVFHPGIILMDELNDRQLTQAEFSAIIDRPARTVNEIIKGKRGITPETAEVIGAALGTSADMWLGMQAEFDLFILNQKRQGKNQEIRKRSELYNLFPIADLVRRQYIKTKKKVDELEHDVLTLLGVTSLDDFRSRSLALYRTSDGDIVQSYLKSWILLGKSKATELKGIGEYKKTKLTDFAPKIRTYSKRGEGIKEIILELNKIGVRVIVLPHFSKTRVDGAACWLDNKNPVVLLSLRYDRIDNFYFTLLHEIGHLLLHDATKTFVDIDIYRQTDNQQEKEANEFATKSLGLENVSDELKYQELTPSVLSRKSNQLEIHPGLLIGHLQHMQLLEYSSYRKLLTRISGSIPAEVIQR